MSRIFYIFIFILFSFQKSNEACLALEVEGMESIKGKLMVAVYTDSKDFPEVGKYHKQFTFKVVANKMTVKLNGLSENKAYAIAVYHDQNNNNKLDKNTFGMPNENYGFSNNARGTFSAPSFESAKFVSKNNKKIAIRIY